MTPEHEAAVFKAKYDAAISLLGSIFFNQFSDEQIQEMLRVQESIQCGRSVNANHMPEVLRDAIASSRRAWQPHERTDK